VERKGEKKDKDTRKRWLLGLVIGANLIILLPIAVSIMMYPDGLIRQTQPTSQKPHLSVDGEGNAHVHYISWIDYRGDQTYNVAYAMIDSQGEITDGPKFVYDYPMTTYPEESEKYLWDSAGNDHFFFSKFDSWDIFNLADEFLKHTVVDSQGQVLIDNNTIASFPWHPDSQHGPAIFGVKLVRRSDDIHIAWYLNTGQGNYFEVYYMKINTDSEILVPPTRLYVYDGSPLIPYYLVFLGIPLVSIPTYFLISRKISTADFSEHEMKAPRTKRTRLAGMVLSGGVIAIVIAAVLLIAPPVLGTLLQQQWGSTYDALMGFTIALAIPMVFLVGFLITFSDKVGKDYRWHQQVVGTGIAISLLATYISLMIIYDVMSPGYSMGSVLLWVIATYPIFLFVVTGLAAERSIRVVKAWKVRDEEGILTESDTDPETQDNEE
jgi:hypothetical protein